MGARWRVGDGRLIQIYIYIYIFFFFFLTVGFQEIWVERLFNLLFLCIEMPLFQILLI